MESEKTLGIVENCKANRFRKGAVLQGMANKIIITPMYVYCLSKSKEDFHFRSEKTEDQKIHMIF